MRFDFQAQAFLTICLTISYGAFQPIESSKDDLTIVSVVTSKSIIDNQIKSEFPENSISKSESPITEASIVDILIKSSKSDEDYETSKIVKKEVNATLNTTAKSTVKNEVTTVKSKPTTEEEDDEDDEYIMPDKDDALKITCIAALCGSGG